MIFLKYTLKQLYRNPEFPEKPGNCFKIVYKMFRIWFCPITFIRYTLKKHRKVECQNPGNCFKIIYTNFESSLWYSIEFPEKPGNCYKIVYKMFRIWFYPITFIRYTLNDNIEMSNARNQEIVLKLFIKILNLAYDIP